MSWLLKFGVSTVSVLTCVLLGELSLHFFAPVPDPYRYHKYANRYLHPQTDSNLQLRTEAEPGLPGMPQVRKRFTTNNYGFRGEALQLPKPAHEFRIFLVGGSTSECFYLDDRESLEAIVQQALQPHLPPPHRVKVYNGGRSGAASDDHISLIAHRIVHFAPDLIVVFAGMNDLMRSISQHDYLHYAKEPHLSFPWLKFFATQFQIPRRLFYLKKGIFPTPSHTLQQITTRSRYQRHIAIRKAAPVTDQPPRTDVQAYRTNLTTLIGTAQAHTVHLVFMTQQTTWQSTVDPQAHDWHWMRYRDGVTYRENAMHEALESLNDAMRQLAVSHGVPLYDLARTLPKSLEFFYDDVHFNVAGARFAGTELASFMLEQNLLPSPAQHELRRGLSGSPVRSGAREPPGGKNTSTQSGSVPRK